MKEKITARPPIWIGHAGPIGVPDLEAAIDCYETLGLRLIHRNHRIAALQLRGGTHLVLDGSREVETRGGVPFDLMVQDLTACHTRLVDAGLEPSPIEQLRNHARFWITDPRGVRIPVHDSHVVGPA